jgi:hypothetical protein
VKIKRGQKDPSIQFPITGFGVSFAVGADSATTVEMLIMKIIELFIRPLLQRYFSSMINSL